LAAPAAHATALLRSLSATTPRHSLLCTLAARLVCSLELGRRRKILAKQLEINGWRPLYRRRR
jgi:hypothetical protein